MGKVKMADLHKLLDLVDETTNKTELHVSLGFSKLGRKNHFLAVSFAVYEMVSTPGTEDFELIKCFGEDFYVGNTNLADDEPYVKCRKYLEGIIKGADSNV